jgi:hypothetical protein
MTPEQHKRFPREIDFLDLLQTLSEQVSKATDEFSSDAGEALPSTLKGLGNTLSLLYRMACCAWGCKDGDHQLEWLVARIVNQAVGAHRLMRSGYYDEALILVRSIGETANLLWLFAADTTSFETWKTGDDKTRRKLFKPVVVRNRLKTLVEIGPPIADDRYEALCEIGTHPTPGVRPDHFSGTGRPTLGNILQEVGVFVCATELSFAVGMSAVAIAKVIDTHFDAKAQLRAEAIALIESLGSFTIINYEQQLAMLPTGAISS